MTKERIQGWPNRSEPPLPFLNTSHIRENRCKIRSAAQPRKCGGVRCIDGDGNRPERRPDHPLGPHVIDERAICADAQ